MKFFPELGLCFGGASVSMDGKTTVTPSTVQEPHTPTEIRRPGSRSKRRRCIKVHSAMQWKPELSAIAEDGVVSDGRRKVELTGRSDNKKTPVNADQTPAAKRSSKYGFENRQTCHQMAIPAFSATPFVF